MERVKVQGVDLDVLMREISAWSTGGYIWPFRRNELFMALRDKKWASPAWNLAGLPTISGAAPSSSSKGLEGELADQALSAMTETAEGLSRAASLNSCMSSLMKSVLPKGIPYDPRC